MTTPTSQLIAMPEGKTLEFKRDLSSPKNMLKTLVAFANTAGGHLVIEVEDDSKEVLGALDAELIEMTIPEKPSSSKQKYRLTAKGNALLVHTTAGRD